MDTHLEVVVIPVSGVDRAKAFARSVAVATIRPSISSCTVPSPILIGMRNPSRPGEPPEENRTGANGGPETRRNRRL